MPATSQVHPILNEVVRATERAAHLTKQLLAYAGKGRFLIETLDLSQQVREISSLIQTSIPRTVQVRLALGKELPCIMADAAQIQQVVMNLVINGAEAIPEGHPGTVLITTRAQEVDETYIQTAGTGMRSRQAGMLFWKSTTRAVGWTKKQWRVFFDPFFTTKFTGRGLGLSAVLGIVKGHKGTVKVYSAPEQGTTFKLLFPATEEEGLKTAGAKTDSVSVAGEGLVLVIDDEEVVRRTARLTLERFGYTVIVAEDGQQGINVFRDLADQIALVLLDMTMPVMSGEETFRELRAYRPDMKVILSSGYNEVEAIRRFTGQGLAGFVQKPYTATFLAQTVAAALRG